MEKKGPAFFKCFFPENSTKQLEIPSAFTLSLSRALPDKVVLRDRYNNMWKVKVDKIRDKFYFSDGWTVFVEDNTIEGGDVLVFDYARPGLFDMRLYGPNACEKKGVGSRKLTEAEKKSVKEEEEKDDEYLEVRKEDEEVKEDEDESSDDDNYVVESEMGDELDEEISSNDCVACRKQETILKQKKKLVKENKVKDDEYHEVKKEDEEGKDEEGESNDDDYVLESEMGDDDWDEEIPTNDTSPGTREKPSRTRRVSDIYGADIFRSGLVPVPVNPYFITKTNVKRKAELYIPKELVKENKLNLPEEILLVDQEGRKFNGKLKIWKDGRRYYGGWRRLCRLNYVEEDDIIICEFIEGRQGLYINVSFVRANQV